MSGERTPRELAQEALRLAHLAGSNARAGEAITMAIVALAGEVALLRRDLELARAERTGGLAKRGKRLRELGGSDGGT